MADVRPLRPGGNAGRGDGADGQRRRSGHQPGCRRRHASREASRRGATWSSGVNGEGGRVTAVLVDAGQTVAKRPGARAHRLGGADPAGGADGGGDPLGQGRRRARPGEPRPRRQAGRQGLHLQGRYRSKTATRDGMQCEGGAGRRRSSARCARDSPGWMFARPPLASSWRATSRPGRSLAPGPTHCSASPRAARWKCARASPSRTWRALRVGMPADVRPVGSTPSIAATIWLIDPVIDPPAARASRGSRSPTRPACAPVPSPTQRSRRRGDAPGAAAVGGDGRRQGQYVYVVGPGNKVVRRNVKVGDVSPKRHGHRQRTDRQREASCERRRLPAARARRSRRSCGATAGA